MLDLHSQSDLLRAQQKETVDSAHQLLGRVSEAFDSLRREQTQLFSYVQSEGSSRSIHQQALESLHSEQLNQRQRLSDVTDAVQDGFRITEEAILDQRRSIPTPEDRFAAARDDRKLPHQVQTHGSGFPTIDLSDDRCPMVPLAPQSPLFGSVPVPRLDYLDDQSRFTFPPPTKRSSSNADLDSTELLFHESLSLLEPPIHSTTTRQSSLPTIQECTPSFSMKTPMAGQIVNSISNAPIDLDSSHRRSADDPAVMFPPAGAKTHGDVYGKTIQAKLVPPPSFNPSRYSGWKRETWLIGGTCISSFLKIRL